MFGLYLQKKIGLVPYDFFGREGTNSFWEWKVWHCHKRFGIMCYIQVLLMIQFLASFFLNNGLLIRPYHPLPPLRLFLWLGLGAIAFREGYEDAKTWNTPKRKYEPIEGRYRWMSVGILLTEAILCWKYRGDTGHINHDAVTPMYIWLPWLLTFTFIIVYWLYLRFKPGHSTKYPVGAKVKKEKSA